MSNSHKLSLFDLIRLFHEDTNPKKLNLTIGVCMDDDKNVFKFKVVQQVVRSLVNSDQFDHNYLGYSGHTGLAPLALRLTFGEDSRALGENRVNAFQTVGGSGALWLGAKLLVNMFSFRRLYLPNPTWAPHFRTFTPVFDQILSYRYYDYGQQRIDFEGMISDLNNAECDSAVLFHASCHNPTGGRLEADEWSQILTIMKERHLYPFFDLAYQGFGLGIETDVLAVRMFAEADIQVVVAQTFSKNFGLYGERVGFLYTVVNDPAQAREVQSELEDITGQTYAIPPAFGAKIVYEILKDAELTAKWKGELEEFRLRMVKVRAEIKEQLERKINNANFDFIVDNEGLFACFNFSGDEAKVLRDQFHVYILDYGRVNLSGLSLTDVDYFTDAMAAVL